MITYWQSSCLKLFLTIVVITICKLIQQVYVNGSILYTNTFTEKSLNKAWFSHVLILKMVFSLLFGCVIEATAFRTCFHVLISIARNLCTTLVSKIVGFQKVVHLWRMFHFSIFHGLFESVVNSMMLLSQVLI